jgi:formamidopyrimidine-DNA glycosylase
MPELPEVETVCRTIAPHVVGRRILAVDVRERRLRTPIASDLAARVEGRTVQAVRRRAKYLIAELGDGMDLVVHLGMSGRLVAGEPSPELTHVHVVLDLEGGTRLYFRDPRRFGRLFLVESGQDRALASLGVEPLGPDFTGDWLWGLRRRHPRVAVKALLMDQRLIAGVGNIYANEALFHARVRPGRRFGRVTRREAAGLVRAVREVLERAIAAGGSSLLDYRDADGNEGEFQRTLFVYEREGLPCWECGNAVRRAARGGRSSFFCAHCQR